MLDPTQIAALVTATKGAVDLFDRIAGQIKSVLTRRPKEAEGEDDRWKYKISGQRDRLIVKQAGTTIQTISGAELSAKLNATDLSLIQTYEQKMEQYFRLWRAVYKNKDASQDPLVNAKTDEQLNDLIVKMRGELLGILKFLTDIGIHLDDHYMHIRYLVEQAE
jgi:hypothetical protein